MRSTTSSSVRAENWQRNRRPIDILETLAVSMLLFKKEKLAMGVHVPVGDERDPRHSPGVVGVCRRLARNGAGGIVD